MRELNSSLVEKSFKDILEYEVISIGDYHLSIYEIIGATVILFLGFLISKIIKSFIYKSSKIDIGKKFAFSQIIHYIIILLVLFMSLRTLGVNISPLLLGSGAILVGVGLGLQNLFLDFISGVIILLDRTIKVGDVLEFEGIVGQVMDIKMRTTTILTRDNKSMIFPNSFLTKEKLVNYSHYNDVVRFDISVGVHYDTDIEKAFTLMKEAALENENTLKNENVFVRLENFGDSSLELKLYFHSNNLFRSPQFLADIRKSILIKFRENDINIPYPIRTLDIPRNFKINEV